MAPTQCVLHGPSAGRMRAASAAGLLLLLLRPARRLAAAETPVLPSGCSLVPFLDAGAPAEGGTSVTATGTCFPEPPDAVDHNKRLIANGPASCTGGLPPGKEPTPLPAGVTCDKAQMSPQLCAVACLAAFDGDVVAIGTASTACSRLVR